MHYAVPSFILAKKTDVNSFVAKCNTCPTPTEFSFMANGMQLLCWYLTCQKYSVSSLIFVVLTNCTGHETLICVQYLFFPDEKCTWMPFGSAKHWKITKRRRGNWKIHGWHATSGLPNRLRSDYLKTCNFVLDCTNP